MPEGRDCDAGGSRLRRRWALCRAVAGLAGLAATSRLSRRTGVSLRRWNLGPSQRCRALLFTLSCCKSSDPTNVSASTVSTYCSSCVPLYIAIV
ncbi:hypothetical protein FA95DRAFT_1212995 [Auriscalpium vulgare]|uniref:Uncharacterized protein n=1 Tax=Auriscalpium vulgare TaxID=40419 RepID=A0ACB8RVI4_9AGAM|nr:hypothetical protein FA95DRAFT_1212995 [Auriscalpium vulgare]